MIARPRKRCRGRATPRVVRRRRARPRLPTDRLRAAL